MNFLDRAALELIQRSQKVIAVFACSLGIVTLAGWYTGIERLRTPLTGLGTIQPLTAVAFLLAGVSLYLWQVPLAKHRIRGAQICAFAVACIGLFSTFSHIAFWGHGSDMQALFGRKWIGLISSPQRLMALTTSISFSFAGGALCLIDSRPHGESRPEEWLVLGQSLLPFTSLLGYIYDLEGFKAPHGSSVFPGRMALPTAIGFLVLAFGILAARPCRGWMARFTSRNPEGVIARRLLPAAFLILLALGVIAEIGRKSGLFGHRFGAASVTALSIVIFGILIDRCTRTLAELECSRREAEANLRRSEEHRRMALDAARVGTWEWDLQSDKIWWSDAIYNIFGISQGSFDGRFESVLQSVHQDDREMVQRAVRRSRDGTEDSYQIEYRIVWPDGTLRYLAARGRTTFGSDGAPVRMAGTAMDVTERKTLERELIEASSREQRRLGQDLHDDLGQWLTAIHLETRGLSMFLEPISDSGAARAEKIANWMREALERTRMLARGMAPAVIETGGLSAALQDLAVTTEHIFHARCQYTCDDTLTVRNPEAALQLYRIAQEAISNALRHGDASEITVCLERQNGRACLSIQDNGKGISTPVQMSSGLGLRIMQYRAELLGADMEIRSEKDRGTQVVCRFSGELYGEKFPDQTLPFAGQLSPRHAAS
ncbi:sensor histidine kinase [Verrucomicrobiota bacterium sgz303538]